MINFEVDGAGLHIEATGWASIAVSDRVERAARQALEQLSERDAKKFRFSYRELLAGKTGNHVIADLVEDIWIDVGGGADYPNPTFQNMVDVKAIAPAPSWADDN